jgi:hypothetical protein
VILDCKKYISVNQTISQRVNDENSSKDFCPKATISKSLLSHLP